MKALLALEDGLYFEGTPFGACGESAGEVVFNTAMTGYQEVMTDPSYKGQIVTMTYPLIGNYGTNDSDYESHRPWVEGFVVKELSRTESNWRSTGSLNEFLKKHNIIGIQGVDTRALTRHIRSFGAKKAVLSTVDLNPDSLIKKARESQGLVGIDLVKEVTCNAPHEWETEEFDIYDPKKKAPKPKYNVVAMDFGAKHNILRKLMSSGCRCVVVPASTDAEKILSYKPDGLFLSNGPGDPEGVAYAVDTVRTLLEKLPIFGICLGHQILGLAFKGKTYKLKFGHHGANHPVMNLETQKVEITSQNHGFAVDINSIADKEVVLTHINLNDKTVEGMRHRKLPVFSVQYHPEASPGPHDSGYLFEKFVRLMEQAKCG
ncbi:MAG: glutamine-hydrolyzing carbamoyl-phosphate synthase small subunit [Candidatus Omnitrophota bacterium]